MQNANAPVSVDELRKFGFIFAGIIAVLFGLLVPWLRSNTINVWPFYIGAPIAFLAAAWPAALRPLYIVWMKFGAVMGFINTHIIMTALFFCMLTPIAWIMKLFGKDPMARKLEKTAQTYRVKSSVYTKDQMEKPY